MERVVESAGVNSAVSPTATSRVTGRLRRLLGKLFWTLVRASWSFIVPLLRIILLVAFMGVISILGYYLLHRSLLPKALLEEPLYFDFSLSPPVARVSLLSHEKQWYYVSDCLKQQQQQQQQQHQKKKHRSKRATTTSGSGNRKMGPDTCNAPTDKTLGSEQGTDGANGVTDNGCDDSDDGSMDTVDDCSDDNDGSGISVDPVQSPKSSSHYDSNSLCGRKGRKSFLRSGSRYTVDVKFGLSTSPKNIQRGKFMVTTTVFDTSGDAVAKSSRPVVIPYQSALTLVVDAAVKYPMRAFGLLRSAEVMDVHVPVMNDFKESKQHQHLHTQSSLPSGASGSGGNGRSPPPPPPGSSLDVASDGKTLGSEPVSGSSPSSPSVLSASAATVTTEYIELELSTADVDIDYSQLTVMPLLSGLAYYMYYFPYVSFLLGVTCFTCLQLAVVLLWMVIKYVSFILFQADDALATGDDAAANATNLADIAAMRQQRGFGAQGGGLSSGAAALRYSNYPSSNRQQQQRAATDFNLAPSTTVQRTAPPSHSRISTSGDRDRSTLGPNNPSTRYVNSSNLRTSSTTAGRPSMDDDYAGRTEAALGQGLLDDEEEVMMLRTERLRREEESRRRRLRRRQQMLSANLEQ